MLKKILFCMIYSFSVQAFPVPEYMKDAEIVVTTKDGKVYKFSGNEYKVVKRTVKKVEKQSVSLDTAIAKTEQPKAVKPLNQSSSPLKHIVSVEAVHSYGDFKTEYTRNSAKAELSKKLGVGVQYQYNLINDLFLGVRVDTNGAKGVSMGVGF